MYNHNPAAIACMCANCTKARREAYLTDHPGRVILFTRFGRG